MQSIGDLTPRQIAQRAGRYSPFLTVIVAMVLLATFFPGATDTDDAEEIDGPVAGRSGLEDTGGTDTTTPADGAGPDEAGDEGTTTTGGATADEPGGEGSGAPADSRADPQEEGTGAVEPAADALDHPDCDPETGRIQFPSRYAPPCVPPFEGDPGATSRGVTSEEIVVVNMQGEADPTADAMLTAAGADDSQEETEQQLEEWIALFETYYETYGRSVRVEHYEVSGEGDEAARADALHVAEEIGAFASFGAGGHGSPFIDELAHRGVLCFCTTSEPIENYHDRAPYVWSTLMASTEAYVHRAEYIGKRLWGQPAEHAGDPLMQQEQRSLAVIYFEDEDQSYAAGVDFFEEELARYGARLNDRIAYLFDMARAQEQARTVISRLQDQGITSVVFSGDPLYPVFFTQEASVQQYFPEWIITGSALTDTSFFARTYDQAQWENAFGVSMLTARVPEELSEAHRIFTWHYGREPTAAATYGVMYPTPWALFTGIHLAGPNLTPQTFRDGMFSYPPTGGFLTGEHYSYGNHTWPWTTYLRNDDMTEIWWDPTENGEDELGNYGPGMYQYVDGGRRYMPGQWPDSAPAVFDPDRSIAIYEELPESDRPPHYEPRSNR